MRHCRLFVLLAVAAIACGGSSAGGGDTPLPVAPAASSGEPSPPPRLSTPTRSAEDDAKALARGNAKFAFDLYHAVAASKPGENLFFSPLSVSMALAMPYAGARGETANAMRKTMHYELPPERLGPAMRDLGAVLTRAPDEPDGFQLKLANALWGDVSTPFEPAFVSTLATDYDASLRLVDFQHAPEPARQEINTWVADATEQRIPELLPPGSITSDARFTAVNAVSFRAKWYRKFDPTQTKPHPFHAADGSTSDVSMMARSLDWTLYAQGDGWQSLVLGYLGGDVFFELLVPDAGRFDEVEAKLTPAWLDVAWKSKPSNGHLALPRFSIAHAGFSARQMLVAMGMGAAFDSKQADLTGIATTKPRLSLFDVVHDATVSVDEEGTEAVAATAVVGGSLTSAPDGPPFDIVVDRPFLFFVRNAATNTVLFIGRVAKP